MGLNLAVAGAGAIVMVNTVNLVQDTLGRPAADVAWLLSANGLGVLVIAFAVPMLSARFGDRAVMLTGGGVLFLAAASAVGFTFTSADQWQWPALLVLWAAIGVGSGAILTPTGNVLRRSSAPHDRPAVFAAQFSLSHACWLLAYPIAGWGATVAGYSVTWMVLAGLAGTGACVALWCWPAREPEALEHVHPADITDLDHVRGTAATAVGYVHTHTFVIDELHRQWPQRCRSAA